MLEDLQALQTWATLAGEKSLDQEQAPVFTFKSPHTTGPFSIVH